MRTYRLIQAFTIFCVVATISLIVGGFYFWNIADYDTAITWWLWSPINAGCTLINAYYWKTWKEWKDEGQLE